MIQMIVQCKVELVERNYLPKLPKVRVHMNVVPRSTGNTNSGTEN